MAVSTLEVQRRERVGKTAARKVRREGLIPAVLYGKSIEAVPLAVDPHRLKEAIDTESKENTLLELHIKGGDGDATQLALIKDVQYDHLTGKPLHIDFIQVDMKEKLVVTVPIVPVGKAKGIINGGILEEVTREIEVECLPGAIPNAIEVDITDLDIGDSIHVGDLELPEGVVSLEEPDRTVLLIGAPAVAAEGAEVVEEVEAVEETAEEKAATTEE